jgi:type VI secretion system secreted protein VgrG
VSQNWAGRGWGGVFIPHVGHEVVVSFLEGDPDLPLVTGRVYNAENVKSLNLPANKTQSSIQDHAGNHITMEGKAGVQDLRANAVKDMNVTVANDYNETVKKGNRTIRVETGTSTEIIEGATEITINAGPLTVTVKKNAATYGSQKATTIKSTEADVHVQAETQIALDVGASHLLMKKDGSVSLDAKQITITGSDKVTIKGGMIYLNP